MYLCVCVCVWMAVWVCLDGCVVVYLCVWCVCLSVCVAMCVVCVSLSVYLCMCGICVSVCVASVCLCGVLHVIDHWMFAWVHSRGTCSRRQWDGHTSSAGWWRPWRRVLWADVCQATGHERSVLLHSTVEPPDRKGCHPSFQIFFNTLLTIISILKIYVDIFLSVLQSPVCLLSLDSEMPH